MSPNPLHRATTSSSEPLSLNLSGPRIDRSSIHVEISKGLEIEAKFFVPRSVAKKITRSLPFARIEQHYFKREHVKPLLERFLGHEQTTNTQLGLHLPRVLHQRELEELSIARIRKTREPGQDPKYFIEFKGAKEGDTLFRISRRELSKPISEELYKALKHEATAGTIQKRRYCVSGTITVDSRVIPVVAQVDCLEAAGKNLRKVKTDFDTVDIELHDATHIHALRSGEHSFDFLRYCIELSSADTEAVKPLSTRRIAKKGLCDEAIEAIKNLITEAQRLHL